VKRVAVLLVVLCAAPGTEGASLRCKNGVVTHGDSIEVVRRKCGEPDHMTGHQKRTRSRVVGRPGAFDLKDVQTWTYRRGYGRFMQSLTFEGGLLVRIDRGPREE
jgi:hypothetical protein